MPNWCDNDLKISGRPEDVTKVLRAVSKSNRVFSFEGAVPYPEGNVFENVVHGATTIDGEHVSVWREVNGKSERIPEAELAEWQAKYGATNWYDWNCLNWGTKWDACDATIRSDVTKKTKRTVLINFNTAWSPPIPVVQALGEQFQAVTFTLRYYERGMEFKGCFTMKQGLVCEHQHGQYNGTRGG